MNKKGMSCKRERERERKKEREVGSFDWLDEKRGKRTKTKEEDER